VLLVLAVAVPVIYLSSWSPSATNPTPCFTKSLSPWRFSDAAKDGKHYRCSEESVPMRDALHIGLLWQRFRDHWIGPVNFDRVGLRISGFENYAIIAAVLLQVLVGFYSGVAAPEDNATKLEMRVYEFQMGCLMIAVLCSTFTMVLFLLAKICAVTSLGLYKDVAYATFLQATRYHRTMAFWSLFTALITFNTAFALDLLRRVKGSAGVLMKLFILVVGGLSLYMWWDVMVLADRYIFSGIPKVA